MRSRRLAPDRVTLISLARRLFNIMAAISLVLCLAMTTMWLRSHWCQDHIPLFREWFAQSEDGRLRIGHMVPWTVATPRNPATSITTLPPSADPRWRQLQATMAQSTQSRATMSTIMVFDGFSEYYVTVVLQLGILPFLWLLFWALRRQQRMDGGRGCLQCGYDLRATPDRCPECGTVPPKHTHHPAL